MAEGVWIPSEILTDPDLSTPQKMILARVEALSEKRGFCFAGDDFLADSLGISKRQVRRHLKALDEAGYLTRRTTSTPQGRHRMVTPHRTEVSGGVETHRTETSEPPDGSVRCHIREEERRESKDARESREEEQLPLPGEGLTLSLEEALPDEAREEFRKYRDRKDRRDEQTGT